MYYPVTPEMLHGAVQMAVMFITIIVAVFSTMFMSRT
jgi:hypothetical protein